LERQVVLVWVNRKKAAVSVKIILRILLMNAMSEMKAEPAPQWNLKG
jgi:hypothetical protein